MARFTRSLLALLFAAVASTAHSAWAPETRHPGSTGLAVGRSALVKAAPRLTSMRPGAGADGSAPARASALPAGLAPDASQAAGERFVGIMAYEGRPAPPGQQLHINGTVIVVQESSMELTVALDGTVTGTGRLVMSRTGSGTPPCADYAVRTLSLTGKLGREGQAFMAGGSGVQAAVLSGMFKYDTRASKVGEAIADCNFGAQHGSGLMGYLTNEPGFAAGSGSARVTDRFFILYDGYAQRGLAHELEKSLRLNPEDFGEHVVGVLSSTAGLVHAAVPASTDDGPIVVRLDYGGVVPKVIPTRGDQRDVTLGGPIREGEVLVVEDDAFVVLQFDDGTTVAVRPGAHFTAYPTSLRPEARSRRIPMALPNGRYAPLVPDQRYGVFYNSPTVGGQVRTVIQDAADCMYRLGEGMHDFLVAPPRQPGDRFRAETNSVSTGVQGTVFRLIDDGTATTVQVVEGRVSVTPKGSGLAGIQLAAGSQARVTLSGVGPIERYSPDTDARDVLGILVAAANAARPVGAPSIAAAVPTVPPVGAGGVAPAISPAGSATATPADRRAPANQPPEVPLPDLSTPEARRRALVDAHAALGRMLVEARAGRTVLIATSEPPGFLPVPRPALRAYRNRQIARGAVTADSAEQIERQWTAGHDAALAEAERQFAELGALISSAGMAPAGRSVTSAAQPGPASAAPSPAPVIVSCDPPGSMAITDGQEAGVLLRTGECVRGVLIDMGADFTMQVDGAERRIAIDDVALIDFMRGGSYVDTDVSRGHVVALRTGATSRGELYDMSERRPLAVTIRGAGGERRISSAEIAYIALADVSVRPTLQPSTATAGVGTPSRPRPDASTPPSSPTRMPPASVPPPPASAPGPPRGMVAGPSETMGATGSGASIFGNWRACDGRMVAFAQEGAEIIGRYTAIGGLPASLFSVGQMSHRLRPTGPGAYQGVVEHRFFDGRREWRDTVVAIDGDRYRDTGSDACSVDMTRIVADPGPAATASVDAVGSGGCGDLSGQWSHVTTGVGSSVFTLTARSDGRYDVTENGLGSGRGVAATSGNRLRYDFTWSGGAGFIDVVLNAGCTQGTGTLQFTAGQSGRFPSTLTRSGDQGEAGRMGTPSVESFAGAWDVESDGVRYVLTLTRKGSRVTGSYGDGQGAVEGTVTGSVLTLRWRHASGRSGTAQLTLSADRARFAGTYAAEASAGLPASRGAWNGVRRMR